MRAALQKSERNGAWKFLPNYFSFNKQVCLHIKIPLSNLFYYGGSLENPGSVTPSDNFYLGRKIDVAEVQTSGFGHLRTGRVGNSGTRSEWNQIVQGWRLFGFL